MYVVAGATGNIGAALARQLAATGEPVRALVRDPSSARLPAGVEPVAADLNDPSSFVATLDGALGLFLLAGYDGLEQLLAEFRERGGQRVVLLSSSAAPSGNLDNAVARYHLLAEQAIEASGLAWTFLRPNSFMSNTFRWADQLAAGDVIRESFGDVPVATVDPDDIAAVGTLALTTGDHSGQAYRLSGPEALTPGDRVAILAAALQRPLTFEPLDDEAARAEMLADMPEEYVDAFFEFFRGGLVDETTVHPTVEDLLGRPPATYADWVQRHLVELR